MRVFLDANVLFSAAYRTESSFRTLFRLAEAGANVLATGDRRAFGPLYDRTLRGVQVLTPARALALVLDQAQG